MKVFEKVVRDELLSKCQHKLNQKQHGFLPHKSCTTQMVDYIDSLCISINDNIRTDVIYFDFIYSSIISISNSKFTKVNAIIHLKLEKSHVFVDRTVMKYF